MAKFVCVVVIGHEGLFKVDIGEDVAAVSQEFPGLLKKLHKPDQVLRGPSNTRLEATGVFQATLEWKGRSTVLLFYVL